MINQNFLNLWADNFIFNDLENSIIQSQDNSKKHENYVADIKIENCKNDMQEILNDQSIDSISIDCVYNNVRSSQQLSELQHILIILNLEREQFEKNFASSSSKDYIFCYIDNMSVIQYISNRHSVLMNDWQNQKYFTEFFSILFSLDFDNHLVKHQKQFVSISLKKWVKWTLSHHNQKYVLSFNIV